jgi:hypothetical protein
METYDVGCIYYEAPPLRGGQVTKPHGEGWYVRNNASKKDIYYGLNYLRSKFMLQHLKSRDQSIRTDEGTWGYYSLYVVVVSIKLCIVCVLCRAEV